jgi:hypothetical protein
MGVISFAVKAAKTAKKAKEAAKLAEAAKLVEAAAEDAAPVARRVAKAAPVAKAPSLAVTRAAPTPPRQLALPAPPRQLALPAPGPGLPPGAAKLRGGQFWIDKDFDGGNMSPEEAARQGSYSFPDANFYVGQETPAQKWLEKSLAKYYKTDFGSPDDPLRALAERGMHYDPEMTPERWQKTVNDYLQEDTIGSVLLPRNPKGGMPGAGDDLRASAMLAMPWLAKLPVTDKIYGIGRGGLDIRHFTDEFLNALNPETSGLPVDLAVRPESLGRMTFPQAVEQVGKINQYRAKEMERAALSAQDSPAVRTFKEYAENNPRGLRWTELKAPDPNESLPQGWRRDQDKIGYQSPEGKYFGNYPGQSQHESDLQALLGDALKYEGDTMGHCVGGYCPDVMEGRSRIFSLRDAKGEPHVTVETRPRRFDTTLGEELSRRDRLSREEAEVLEEEYVNRAADILRERDPPENFNNRKVEELSRDLAGIPWQAEDIVQIKGKQNRAPKDDYLPFVQDFVKSQKWGNVGDLGNTGLVKLPDGRYITSQQMDEVVRGGSLDDLYQSYDFNARGFPRDPASMDDDAWQQFQRHFEGYAVGGRVSADRCFSRHPMSVR